MITLDSCLNRITSAAIAGHVRPDGDSVGACLAVYNYICDNYPDIRADVYLEPIPAKFSFLKNADRIRDPKKADGSASYDVFFSLDCGDEERLGGAAAFFRSAKYTVCVDHHLTNSSFARVNEVDPNASSTSELIFRMMDPDKVTEEIAECLYLGIVHDTGVFQYSCTSPETMRIAGELMAKGIPYSRIVDETYYIRSYPQQKIWGKALLTSRLFFNGACIVSTVTQKDMEQYQVTPEDLDGIVSELRSTSGVEVAVFLYETTEGYKISLRSASYVDVAKIALTFGGGGHARAAGASADGDPEEILHKLLPMIGEQL
ncbi:MAG: DHH family phosphoesterase [Lachnospiraceae bacterium]|nr:DHH family phosphoesterase [Lachnospiraceae bacterium]